MYVAVVFAVTGFARLAYEYGLFFCFSEVTVRFGHSLRVICYIIKIFKMLNLNIICLFRIDAWLYTLFICFTVNWISPNIKL